MTVPTKKICFYMRVRPLIAVVTVLSVIFTIAQLYSPLLEYTAKHIHGDSNVTMTTMTTRLDLGSVQKGTSPQPSVVMESSGREKLSSINGTNDQDMTIVTSYFNLGFFRKGSSQRNSTKTYTKWVKTFKYLNNPLVFYTDSAVHRDFIRSLRKGMEQKTKIILVNRTHFWTFQIRDQIKKIFRQKGYPKHYPNTVLPEYSCIQHTKYAAVAEAVRKKYFKSKCYAWLDIGYFRDIVNSKRYFSLNLLDDFDKNKLTYNLVYPSLSLNISYKAIVYGNKVWVGGGMFIGTADVITAFEAEYHRAVMFLLDKQLMSTDQQVILSMYSLQGQKDLNVTIPLQLYSRKQNETNLKNGNPWFYLGYKCLNFTSA